MIIDGNAISTEIKKELSARVLTFDEPPSLTIFYDEENTTGTMYVSRKEAFAKEIGIIFHKIAFSQDETIDEAVDRIKQKGLSADGVIVQLPVPKRFDTDVITAAIPFQADVDLVSEEGFARFEGGHTSLLPPMVAAIKLIAEQHSIRFEGAHVLVIGEGRLVGKPVATWMRKRGAGVTTVNENTPDVAALAKSVDIIVLGAGAPGMLTPAMIKDGVIIFDAGSTLVEGRARGDADPACAEMAKIFTPVPGGLGPLAIACAFQNLLHLAAGNKQKSNTSQMT